MVTQRKYIFFYYEFLHYFILFFFFLLFASYFKVALLALMTALCSYSLLRG